MSPTSEDRTAVCCLSSLNQAKYDEWQNTTVIEDMITFLDNVIEVFITSAPDTIQKAKWSAFRERSLGLGVMGYSTYLKSHLIPFESEEARRINIEFFANLKTKADAQSRVLANIKGEAPDMEGTGRRNAYLLAVAPTANNAIIVGVSPSIEPDNANLYVQKTRIGSFVIKDKALESELDKLGMNTPDVWQSITVNNGSVQHLNIPLLLKEVFKTAVEIDQHEIVRQAGDRQKYICHGQSLNVWFKEGDPKSYVNSVHLYAHSCGVKGMYYLRNRAKQIDAVSNKTERVNLEHPIEVAAPTLDESSCAACEG